MKSAFLTSFELLIKRRREMVSEGLTS